MADQNSAKILDITSHATSNRIGAAMDEAIALADEIVALANEENQRLASGRPTSLDDLLARKQRLVSEFSAFFRAFKQERDIMLLAPQDKFDALQQRVQILAHAMLENADNLNKAANANERRIDAIMKAIRDEQGQQNSTAYGAQGQQATQHQPLSLKGGIKA